jgi:hypothetical protein
VTVEWICISASALLGLALVAYRQVLVERRRQDQIIRQARDEVARSDWRDRFRRFSELGDPRYEVEDGDGEDPPHAA